jgi:hypothetical protein
MLIPTVGTVLLEELNIDPVCSSGNPSTRDEPGSNPLRDADYPEHLSWFSSVPQG